MAIRLLSGLPEGGARTELYEASILWEPEIVAAPAEVPRARVQLGAWLVTLAALAACLALTLPTIIVPLGYRAVVVMSGSMAPRAEPGDVFVVRKVAASDVRVGDIVTFRPLRDDHLVTHRVTARRYVAGELHFQTKGDANVATDPDLVPARNVIGRVTYHAPWIGRAYVFALGTTGRIALVVVPALFLIAQELRLNIRRKRRKGKNAGRRVATVVLVAIACSAAVGPAAARFTDTVSANGNTFATGTLNAPTLNSATSGPINVACRVDLAWSAPSSGLAPDGYDVYRKTTGAYSLVKHVGTVTSTSDTDPALSALTNYTYKLQSTLQSWRSADSNTRSVTTVVCL
jgi:signal peptidase